MEANRTLVAVKTVQLEVVTHSLRAGGSKVAFLAHVPFADTLRQFGKFLVGVELFGVRASWAVRKASTCCRSIFLAGPACRPAVRGGVQAFAAAVGFVADDWVCPAADACASSATTIKDQSRQRRR